MMDSLNYTTIVQGLLSESNLTTVIEANAEQRHAAEQLAKCHQYARFMENISRGWGEIIYWSLLALILFCLITSAWTYSYTEQHYK
jgi:hypothetical protein